MKSYNHVLLAVDFFEPAQVVINRAKSLTESYQATLSLIHVVDNMPLPDAGYGLDAAYNVDLTGEMIIAAKHKLTDLAKKLGVEQAKLYVELGGPKFEITRIAEENQVDLIVLGSHGRHGLALLLGSTATGVLHHAKCDVLAVRLKDN
jgi:universal stress protein A